MGAEGEQEADAGLLRCGGAPQRSKDVAARLSEGEHERGIRERHGHREYDLHHADSPSACFALLPVNMFNEGRVPPNALLGLLSQNCPDRFNRLRPARW